MLMLISTIDNALTLPTPVLDDSSQGYHLEDRLQVTVKSLANDKSYTVEFRLGEGSDAPSEAQLIQWMESGEAVRVVCSGVTARPFVHQDGKQYRSRGSEKEINGAAAVLDTLIVFAGQSITPASATFDLDEEVRKARGAYKKAQREFRQRLNADRVEKAKAQLAERVAKMQEARAKQQQQQAQPAAPAGADAAAGSRRSK
jgi:hypothetical protein